MRARFCRFGGTTTTWSDHTVVSAISRLQSSPETAPPECNRTGRCATLRAPHPVLLLRRAIQAQINLRLYSTLDESWGSRHILTGHTLSFVGKVERFSLFMVPQEHECVR